MIEADEPIMIAANAVSGSMGITSNNLRIFSARTYHRRCANWGRTMYMRNITVRKWILRYIEICHDLNIHKHIGDMLLTSRITHV